MARYVEVFEICSIFSAFPSSACWIRNCAGRDPHGHPREMYSHPSHKNRNVARMGTQLCERFTCPDEAFVVGAWFSDGMTQDLASRDPGAQKQGAPGGAEHNSYPTLRQKKRRREGGAPDVVDIEVRRAGKNRSGPPTN